MAQGSPIGSLITDDEVAVCQRMKIKEIMYVTIVWEMKFRLP